MQSPSSQAERFSPDEAHALSKQQVQSFFTNGYVIVPQLFTLDEISYLKALVKNLCDEAKIIAQQYICDHNISTSAEFRCDYNGPDNLQSASILSLYRPNDPDPAIKLISWAGGIESKLIEAGRQPKITIPVAQLLGSNKADHLINQVHYKIPNDQVTFKWHQDIQNRRTFDPQWQDINKKGSFVQVLTALDETTATNGPLIIIPNSHKTDLDLDKVPPNTSIIEIIEQNYSLSQCEPLLVKPGGTIFMHPLLLHKSEMNISDTGETRDLLINGFSYPKANHKPYPGKGSAREIDLPISSGLLDATNNYVADLLGSIE